jgi:hypothetical protein
MNKNTKKIELNKESFIECFKNGFIETGKSCLWLIIPVVLLLLLVRIEVLSENTSNLILMILGVLLMILGLPLSAALRVDELSIELGNAYSREVVLLIALLVAVVNICIILGVRVALIKRKNEH